MIAIAFYVVFSSLAAWCAFDDASYHLNKKANKDIEIRKHV